MLYSVAGLPNGSHTIKIEVTGKKKDDASNHALVIDAFELMSH